MDKKKIEMIAIPVLALVFVVVFSNALFKAGIIKVPGAIAGAPKILLDRARKPAILQVSSAQPLKEKGDESLEWGRDPFAPIDTPAAGSSNALQGVSLQGITRSADTSKGAYAAIINDEIVSTGASVGSLKVVEISKDGVILTDGKERYVLGLEEASSAAVR